MRIKLKEMIKLDESKVVYTVSSPDGIPIEFDIPHYNDFKSAKKSDNNWKKRFEKRGFYSSPHYGRIPLEDLDDYMEFNKIRIKQ